MSRHIKLEGKFNKTQKLEPVINWQEVDKWYNIDHDLPKIDEPIWLWDEEKIWIGVRVITEDNTWLWANTYMDVYYCLDQNKWIANTAEVDDDYKPTKWKPLTKPPVQK